MYRCSVHFYLLALSLFAFVACGRSKQLKSRTIRESRKDVDEAHKRKSRTVAIVEPVLRQHDISLPTAGFITSKVGNTSLTMKVSKIVNRPPICQMIGFMSQPKPNTSPFSGEQVFHVILDEMVNDRYAWTNGVEFLSYVKHDDDKLDKDLGTWIIGSDPGKDNGFVFLRVNNTHTLSPIGLEGEESYWHWLSGKEVADTNNLSLSIVPSTSYPAIVSIPYIQWKEQSEMRAVCVDKYAPTARYYEVEYFDPGNHAAKSSYLVSDFSPYLLAEQDAKQEVGIDFDLNLPADSPVVSTLLDPDTSRWVEVNGLAPVLSYGEAYAIFVQSSQRTYIAVLINDEHSSEDAWRLTFRKYHLTAEDRAAAVLSEDDDEILLEWGNDGVRGKEWTVSPLNAEQRAAFTQSKATFLLAAKPGDYLWLWLSPSPVNPETFDFASYTQREVAERADELLVKCVARSNSTLLFQYYPTNRLDAMKQTVLLADNDFFSVALGADISSLKLSLQRQEVVLNSVFPIGRKVISFLQRYIVTKEGHPNGMSSCYMYHAAASMPQALLYATEILCVLMGYKPLTLIQYTSASEHQWKFPLVRELSQAISAAKLLLGDSLDLKVRMNKYKVDETLVIYRSGQEFVNEGLLPKYLAQALHPLPYPDSEKPEADWRKQIYNAWWNGVILGYPEFFVDGYCESFHNGLEKSERVVEMKQAKQALEEFLRSIHRTAPRIGKGNDIPIPDEHMQLITSIVESS